MIPQTARPGTNTFGDDLWGPAPVCSHGSTIYMMPIVNTEHQVKELYFMSNKEAQIMLTPFCDYNESEARGCRNSDPTHGVGGGSEGSKNFFACQKFISG